MNSGEPVVLVAGAINTDLVATVQRAAEAGETVTGTGFAIFGGGKGANQAVAAARSGGRVSLVGAVGDDQFGRDRLADLTADGIDVEAVSIRAGSASGVALITVETGGENRIAYVPGATLEVTAEAALAAYRKSSPAVVLAPNELAPAVLELMFGAARADGVPVVLNAAPDPGLVIGLLEHVSVLITNEHEGREILGEDVSGHDDVAKRLAARFGLTAIVTAGAAGAFAHGPEGAVHVAGIVVKPVDTTGAGDTFCGAFACELARGSGLREAMLVGVHAAGISVTRPGAQASIPGRDEVLAALNRGPEA